MQMVVHKRDWRWVAVLGMAALLALVLAPVAAAEDIAGDYQVVALVQEAGIVIDPPGAEVQIRILDAAEHVPLAVGTILEAQVDIIEYEAFWQHAAGKAYPMVLFRSHSHDPWQVGQPGDEVRLDDLPAAEAIDPEQQRRAAIERVLDEAGGSASPAQPPASSPPGSYRPGMDERQVLLDELAAITDELEALGDGSARAEDRRQRAALLAELEAITVALEALRPEAAVFDADLRSLADEAAAAVGDDPVAQALADDLRALAALDGLRADTALSSLERLGRRAGRQDEPMPESERVAPLIEPSVAVPQAVAPSPVPSAMVRVLDAGPTWLVMYQGQLRPGPAQSADGRRVVVEAADGRFAVLRAGFPAVVDQRLVIIQAVEDDRL